MKFTVYNVNNGRWRNKINFLLVLCKWNSIRITCWKSYWKLFSSFCIATCNKWILSFNALCKFIPRCNFIIFQSENALHIDRWAWAHFFVECSILVITFCHHKETWQLSHFICENHSFHICSNSSILKYKPFSAGCDKIYYNLQWNENNIIGGWIPINLNGNIKQWKIESISYCFEILQRNKNIEFIRVILLSERPIIGTSTNMKISSIRNRIMSNSEQLLSQHMWITAQWKWIKINRIDAIDDQECMTSLSVQ